MKWDIMRIRYCTKTLLGHAEWVRTVRCSEDGKLAVTASNDQMVRVWDISSSGETKVVELRGHDHVVECAIFVPTTAYTTLKELVGTKLDVGTRKKRIECCCEYVI